jgi:hypothetical protein
LLSSLFTCFVGSGAQQIYDIVSQCV